MRFILGSVSAFFLLGGTALAQTADCKLISDAAARLACYDKGAPPVAAAAKPNAHPNPYRSKIDSGKYMDSLSTEDALVTSRMSGICRGC